MWPKLEFFIHPVAIFNRQSSVFGRHPNLSIAYPEKYFIFIDRDEP